MAGRLSTGCASLLLSLPAHPILARPSCPVCHCVPLQLSVLYLKPAQTGFPADSDARLVAAAAHLPLAAGPHAAHLLGSSSSSSSENSSSSSSSSGGGSHLAKVLYAWSRPVSPHLAVELEGRSVSDRQLAAAVAAELRGFAAAGLQASGGGAGNSSIAIVETAGGVASPGPSGTLQVGGCPLCCGSAACLAASCGCWCRVRRVGTPAAAAPESMAGQGPAANLPKRLRAIALQPLPLTQCDLLRPLRLPGILVGDGRLGGISATLSAYDSLVLRGHSVPLVVLMDGNSSGSGQAGANTAAIQRHLRGKAAVLSFPVCEPPPAGQPGGQQGEIDASLAAWLEASAPQFDRLVHLAKEAHHARLSQLQAAAGDARRMLWWPFTQHASVAGDAGVTVIDSRVGECFSVYRPPAEAAASSRGSGSGSSNGSGSSGAAAARGSLELLYDACASWWTQGVSDFGPCSWLQCRACHLCGVRCGICVHLRNLGCLCG